MYDIYFDLIIKLEEKRFANSDSERQSIRQDIKRIADRLKKQLPEKENAWAVFDAACCYYVAGYYVQAQALAINAQIDNAHAIQKWILYFLAKNFKELNTEILNTNLSAEFEDAVIQEGINSGNLSSYDVVELAVTAKIAEGLLYVISFIETGDDKSYARAVEIFLSCQKLLCKTGEWQVWWWVECLRIITEEFVANSLWQVLKPMRDNLAISDAVTKYIVANYGTSTIIEFWRTQIESLPWINDPERCSFCISVPTSAGKTKAAELAVLRFLLDYWNEPDKKCVYIAPLRALCQEVENSFLQVFGQFQPSIVSTFYGGYEIDVFDEYLLAKTRILIVTPEKLDGMLRQYPELKSQIKLVIADEGHLIGEKDRLTYRFLLERLVYLFRKKSTSETRKPRIVFISGVLPNMEDFAELISGSRDNVVKINWRPTDEPKFFKWVWNGQGWGSWKFDGQNWQKSTSPIPEQMQNCNIQDRFSDQIVKTAISQSKSDNKVMVFSANKYAIKKPDFMELLNCIAQHSPYGGFEAIDPVLKTKYPDETLLLENGISVHHADIPPEIRQEIERRVKTDGVRLLFASPTLAQGVNMPFDIVLIYNLHYDNYKLPISHTMFWNVVGRVGRPIAQLKANPKIEAPKVVFLLNQSSMQNARMCDDLMREREKYKVQSPFLDFLNEIRKNSPSLDIPKLVSELAEIPKLKDAIGEGASAKWGKMTLEECLIALDKHLIALVDEVDVDITLEWMQQSVKELVDLFVQASVIKDNDFDYISEVVLARLKFIAKHIPKEKRRQDYLLGLPYDDCEKIKQNVENLLMWYQGSIGLFNNNHGDGLANLVNIMKFVTDLTICKKYGRRKSNKNAEKARHSGQLSFELKADDKVTIAQRKLFENWINGKSGDELSKQFKVFGKYQELEKTLPWGISTIARFLSTVAKEKQITLPPDLEYLPSMVKYGANSKIACHLIRLNLTRKYAIPIADLYISKLSWDENNESGEVFYRDFSNAVNSLQVLTDEEIKSLGIDEVNRKRIQKILDWHKVADHENEPEFPPLEIEINE
jgi:hypothetical protein